MKHSTKNRCSFTALCRDQSGASAVLLGIVMTAMMGFVGLGVEVSLHYMERREMQSAVDSAALSAANVIYKTDANTYPTADKVGLAAKKDAARNGYTNGGDITVATTYPPTSGSQAANSNAVTVAMTQVSDGMFASIFGQTDINNKTQATAVVDTTGNTCIRAFEPTEDYSITFTGNPTINTVDCGIRADSTGIAYSQGGSAKANTDFIRTVGDSYVQKPENLNTVENNDQVIEGEPYLPDPYADLPEPTVPGTCNLSPPTGGGTLNPGCYKDMAFYKKTYTLNPGLYIVNSKQDFWVPGGATVTGDGVTIFLTGGAAFKVEGNADLSATTDASSPYQDILVFMNRDQYTGNSKWAGNGGGFLEGVIYMKSEHLEVRGSLSPAFGCTQVLVDEIEFTGTTDINVNVSGCTGTFANLAGATRFPPRIVE